MIGVVHRLIPGAGVEVMSLGPLWPGVVIRGVWMSIYGVPTGSLDIALALCDGPVVDLTVLQSGQSLVISTDTVSAQLGMTFYRTIAGSSIGREWILPVYVPIRTGSAWVGVGIYSVPVLNVTVGLVVEPERSVSPALERGSAARRRGVAGGVMSSLEEAALAARG